MHRNDISAENGDYKGNTLLTSEFYLSNVRCAGCVAKIQKAVLSLPQIKHASVDLIDKTLYIEYADNISKANINKEINQQITASVTKLGYGISASAANKQFTIAANHYLAIGIPIISGIIFMLASMFIMPPYVSMNIANLVSVIEMLSSLFILLITAETIFISGIRGILRLNFNMHSLITLSVLAAWGYSTLVVLKIIDLAATTAVYFDSVLIIIGLINLGSYLEHMAQHNTFNAIKELLKLQPSTTTIIVDDQEQQIATNLLRTDYIVKIKPGEQISADGIITQGSGYINQAMLTGEAVAVLKQIGDKVIAGTINTSGAFCFKVTATGANTVLAEIINLVKSAQHSKPRLAKFADRIAQIFVPSIILIALLSALAWYEFGPAPQDFYAITIFMTVLIIACPCALGLAIPMSLMVGLGKSATYGILIRNANALEQLTKLDYILFDKTGTITQGTPQVITAEFTNIPANASIMLAKSLATNSEHPLAQAILAYLPDAAHSAELAIKPVENFNSIIGAGVSGIIDGSIYYLGSTNLLQQHGISLTPAFANLNTNITHTTEAINYTAVYLANAQKVLACFKLSDAIKADASDAINILQHDLGLKVAMLTGDNLAYAKAVAKEVSISEQQIFAEQKPQDKIARVKQLQQEGNIVAFVGDGINDAPSLAQANVGIAIGSGTDIAIHSADVTLMHNSLMDVVRAISISKAINKNMRSNLFGAFIYNIAAVTIAAGALYPIWHVLLNPVIAAIAMSMSSITVVTNANRLRWL